jgi:hypothetical protein
MRRRSSPCWFSKEYVGLWNATASVRVVVVALPPAASVAVAATLGSAGRGRSVKSLWRLKRVLKHGARAADA